MQRHATRLFALTLATVLAFTVGPIATADPDDPIVPSSIGEVIVGFEPGELPDVKVGESYLGFEVVRIVEQGPFLVVAAYSVNAVEARTDGVENIAYVEDNGLLHALVTPNDSRYGEQWGPEPMGFETAWDQGFGSSGITVAVLDSGIRKTHQDFISANLLQGWDYVNNDNNPNDDCGHGTHVSGTVGANTNNALGVAGMSESKILPYKVLANTLFIGLLCSGSTAGIAEAIMDAADAGARIVTMSLGSTSGAASLENAVNYAWNAGVLVVAAAGNENGGSVNYPAAYANSIAVSALDDDLTIASYSSVGPQVDVSAPGSNVLSTYNSNDASYSSLSGTSMAAPHVAGALALVLSNVPTATAVQVRSVMESTAQDLGAPGRDNTYGYGMVRVDLMIDALSGPPNTPPVAAFTKSAVDRTVSVDGSASTDADGDALTYSWNWGDGATTTGVTSSHSYAVDGTYTITLTASDGNGGSDTDAQSITVTGPPPPPNNPPTAAFTASATNLVASFNGAASSDPDGDPLTYSWTFGDGGTATGVSPSHTYAAAGTYTVTLTVNDGRGGSDSESAPVTVTAPADPDPSTPNLQSGTTVSVTLSASAADKHYKIQVPAGMANLKVKMTGPGCSLLNCPLDADLYTNYGSRATDSDWDCRPYTTGNNEECNHGNPQSGWWYVRVKRYSGSGTVQLTATIT